MNTCKDCKWWKRTINKVWRKSDEIMSFGECEHPKVSYGGEPATPDGVGYWDQENYNAFLRTGEDFGCVHWESDIVHNADDVYTGILFRVPALEYLDGLIYKTFADTFPVTIPMPCGKEYQIPSIDQFPRSDVPCACGNELHRFVGIEIDETLDQREKS